MAQAPHQPRPSSESQGWPTSEVWDTQHIRDPYLPTSSYASPALSHNPHTSTRNLTETVRQLRRPTVLAKSQVSIRATSSLPYRCSCYKKPTHLCAKVRNTNTLLSNTLSHLWDIRSLLCGQTGQYHGGHKSK